MTRTHSVGLLWTNDRPIAETDLCLTTHNTHKRQTSVPLAGFEPTIPASELPQTHALERAATGAVLLCYCDINTNVHFEFKHYIP